MTGPAEPKARPRRRRRPVGRPRTAAVAPRQSANPCQECGTTGGPFVHGSHGVFRTRGLCRRCYQRLARIGRLPVSPAAAVDACAACGTTGGYRPADHRGPARYDGARYGIDGPLCKGCRERCRRRARAGGPPLSLVHLTLPTEDRPAAIAPRVAVVRAAKQTKAALGLDPDLTPEELDAILPPVDCRRTRQRLANHEPEGHPGPVVPVPAAARLVEGPRRGCPSAAERGSTTERLTSSASPRSAVSRHQEVARA